MEARIILSSLARLAKAVPSFAPNFADLETAEIWCDAFADLSDEAFARGLERAQATCHTFPSIAVVRKLALKLSSNDDERKAKAARIGEEVWRQGVFSRTRKPDSEGLVAHVLAAMGGPVVFQNYREDEHDFVVKRATTIALGLLHEGEREANVLGLTGAQLPAALEAAREPDPRGALTSARLVAECLPRG